MKVLIAVDSFKGSLTSKQAAQAIKEGIKQYCSKIIVKPLADGGEGTMKTLTNFYRGKIIDVKVNHPLFNKINAEYGMYKNTAIIEIAACIGLPLLNEKERNPLYTSSYGVGEIINDAIHKGARNFIIGIGGSSTNDVGIGMLQALGYRFLDKNKNELPFGCVGLKDFKYLDESNINPELKECTFNVACDVNNPLCGKNGASYIYGPQKGADNVTVKLMNKYHCSFIRKLKKYKPESDDKYPGCGAAGGLGFAFKTFLNANLQSGINLILDTIKLEKDLIDVDYVIVGEGKLDKQTVMGKAPIGVVKLAKKHHKPVIGFAGIINDEDLLNKEGIDACFSILKDICSKEEAMNHKNAYNNLKQTANQVFRLISQSKKL